MILKSSATVQTLRSGPPSGDGRLVMPLSHVHGDVPWRVLPLTNEGILDKGSGEKDRLRNES